MLFGADIATVQLVAFPVIILILFWVRLLEVRVPRLVLVGAGIAALAGVSVAYVPKQIEGPGFYVAKLEDDQYEAQSRIFRESIREFLAEQRPIEVIRYHYSFASNDEARSLADESSPPRPVVWGDSTWIDITFPKRRPIKIAELGSDQLFSKTRFRDYQKQLEKLRVHSDVSSVGLPPRPEDATADYVASVNLAFWSDALDLEEALLRAATIESPWRTKWHMGYPWWRLGTHYLRRALAGDSVELGELKCAVKAFREAAGQVSQRANPEIFAVIYNSLGIAEFLYGLEAGGKGYLKRAIGSLERSHNVALVKSNKVELSPLQLVTRVAKNNLKNVTKIKTAIKGKR